MRAHVTSHAFLKEIWYTVTLTKSKILKAYHSTYSLWNRGDKIINLSTDNQPLKNTTKYALYLKDKSVQNL